MIVTKNLCIIQYRTSKSLVTYYYFFFFVFSNSLFRPPPPPPPPPPEVEEIVLLATKVESSIVKGEKRDNCGVITQEQQKFEATIASVSGKLYSIMIFSCVINIVRAIFFLYSLHTYYTVAPLFRQ